MNIVSKLITGALATAFVASPLTAPAQARDWDRGGFDGDDVIAGVAVLGGAAAITAALGHDRYDDRGFGYGYGHRDFYRRGYSNAVNACASQAERFGRGQVRIFDVDRRGDNRFRVRGTIQRGFGGGFGGYGGYDSYRHSANREFRCTAFGNGRIVDFDLDHRW